MSLYVMLDVRFFAHPKIAEIGRKPAFLFIRALCWCQEELTDGCIPKRHASILASDVEVPRTAIKELVRVGLWHDRGDHYEIHDWQDWMKSRAYVERKREEGRLRVAEWRSRRDGPALQVVETLGCNSVTNGVRTNGVTL